MRGGSSDSWGHRGGEPYGGLRGRRQNDAKLEPVNLETDDYPAMDNPSDHLVFGPEQYGWDIDKDEEEE